MFAFQCCNIQSVGLIHSKCGTMETMILYLVNGNCISYPTSYETGSHVFPERLLESWLTANGKSGASTCIPEF